VTTTAQSDLIDEWVTAQLQKPWPLNSVQLDLIGRALRMPSRFADCGRHVSQEAADR
jgi:hypothetical protein